VPSYYYVNNTYHRPDANLTDFTVEAWIKIDPTSDPTGGALVSKAPDNWNGSDGMYSLLVTKTSMELVFSDYGGWCSFAAKATFADIGNKWVHVAAQRKGGTASLYLNGKALAFVKSCKTSYKCPNCTADISVVNDGPILIGRHDEQSLTHLFKGAISELRISIAAVYSTDFVPKEQLDKLSDTFVVYHVTESCCTLNDDAGGRYGNPVHAPVWSKDCPSL